MSLTPSELHQLVAPHALRITGGSAIRVETLAGGASLRRYHRVHAAGGALATLIVMELAGDRLASEEASKATGIDELPFINVLRYLERGGIGVPHLHHHDEVNGLLFLEDLGDITFESRVQGAGIDTQRTYYRLAIDGLIRLQRYGATSPSGCVAFQRGFDQDLLKWELDHFREWGMEAGAGIRLAPAERTLLDEIFGQIAAELAGMPRVLVHRDYQSRNLMVEDTPSGPRLRLIDFQDALLGTAAYDLVALLRDSYVVLPPALVLELVDYHAAQAHTDPATFRRLFDLQTVQRKLKDAGRFVYIDRVKKNPGFLPYIPTSQAYAAAALGRLPELAPLRELLARHMPAFRA